MLGNWCRIMLDFLADPGVISSFELLETEQKRVVKEFQARKKLPGEISEDFIQGMQLLFQGLDRVTFSVNELKGVLRREWWSLYGGRDKTPVCQLSR